jgi:hypothetical protein
VPVRFLIGVMALFALVAGCSQRVPGSALPSSGDVAVTGANRPSSPQSKPLAPRSTSTTRSSGGSSSDGQVPVASLEGTWEGTYTCGQGETGLKLTIGKATASGKAADVTFDFFPTAGNSSVPTGSYEMGLEYSPSAGALMFTPVKWIQQPDGYEMVPLIVQGTPGPDKMTGKVMSDACTTFTVTRK